MGIREKIRTVAMAVVLTVVGSVGVLTVGTMKVEPAWAECKCEKDSSGNGWTGSDGCSEVEKGICAAKTSDNDNEKGLPEIVNGVINTILYIVGILAVVMVIFGGVQYTTSAGDQAKVTKAKNTILYGLIGLIVAVLAYAIVNFVVGKLLGSN